jgi:hypothetical protein
MALSKQQPVIVHSDVHEDINMSKADGMPRVQRVTTLPTVASLTQIVV